MLSSLLDTLVRCAQANSRMQIALASEKNRIAIISSIRNNPDLEERRFNSIFTGRHLPFHGPRISRTAGSPQSAR